VVTASGAPSNSDESLGPTLARLRHARNLTGRQLGELVNMSQPKISRLENGIGIADPDDVEVVARALEAPDDLVARLVELAEQAQNRMTDWRPFTPSLPDRQRGISDMENDVRVLRVFQPIVVPGLLQTSDYARAVLTAHAALLSPKPPGTAVSETVSLRVARQEALADPTRTFHFVFTETALINRVCAPEYMPAQLQRVRDVARQENVTVRIVPADVNLVVPPIHGFVLADDSTVLIDLLNTGISSSGRRDVAFYQQVFAEFEQQSVTDIDPLLDRYLEQSLQLLQGKAKRSGPG
jgi:transcriptional regulator with XRE-family HTH domain